MRTLVTIEHRKETALVGGRRERPRERGKGLGL